MPEPEAKQTFRSPQRNGKPLVVVRELQKTFLHMGRALDVLRGIDLEINEGEVIAIVGKSGAGKSTLLQCIGTLDLPSSGIIRLGEQYLVGMSRAELAGIRNRMIGFVFQFHHLLPEFNALENVMMPGLIQGLPRADIEKRARTLLEDVGLTHRTTHRPGELSGGEQQRVALARALVLEPKLILADEPTGNLDTATSDAIHKLFFDINVKHGTTIVVVTHNTKLADSMPRVVTMLDGKVAHDSRESEEPFVVDPKVLERSRALAKVAYANFWHRAAARFLDLLTLLLLGGASAYGAAFVLVRLDPSLERAALLLSRFNSIGWVLGLGFINSIVFLIAQGVSEWRSGATLWKFILGLRVREETLDRPTFGTAMLRNLLMIIDGIFFGLVGFLGMKVSLLKQRFGDGLAQSVVVNSSSLPKEDSAMSWGPIALGLAVNVMLHVAIVIALWFT